MTTTIYDRRGKPAPAVTVAELRRRPGHFWKLTEQRGAVVISRDEQPLAVALSLDQFVSLLFGLANSRSRKRRAPRKMAHKKR